MRPAESFISQPVRSLQTMLRVIGEDRGEPTTIIPDGIYGTQTRNAVTRFQRTRGLPVTGAADSATWDRITAEYPDAFTRVGQAERVAVAQTAQATRVIVVNSGIGLIEVLLLAQEVVATRREAHSGQEAKTNQFDI